MTVTNRARMLCTSRGHNKEYVIELEDNVGRYRVVGRYGRIGANLVETVKYEGTSLRSAIAEFSKVRDEKLSKGYEQASNYTRHTPETQPQPAPARSRVRTPPPEKPRTVEFYDNEPRMITL